MTAIAAIFNIVPGWVYGIVLALMLAVGVTQELRISTFKVEVAAAKQASATQRLDYEQRARSAEAEARSREFDLHSFIDKLEATKNAEINTLNTDLRTLRKRLSDLPTRPAGDPGAKDASFGQATQGCAGPVLYRDTAEALADEAGRADLIRINLQACYSAWDKASEITQGSKDAGQ